MWASQGTICTSAVDWLCPAQYNKLKAWPFFIIIFVRDVTDSMIWKNTKTTITWLKEGKKKYRLSVSVHKRFWYGVNNSDRNSQNRAGHGKSTIFVVIICFIYWVVFLVIPRDGWRIRQWKYFRASLLIRSGAHNGPLHRRTGSSCCDPLAVDVNHVDKQIYIYQVYI